MNRSREWLVPLTGVGFIVLSIISFAIMGEPKSADEPVDEIVDYYLDNKDAIMVSTFVGVAGAALFVFFAAYLRRLIRAAAGEGEMLSIITLLGALTMMIGFAIDGTILLALAESADDIEPTSVQTLQALWDNDFVPIALGVILFLWSTGISVIRTGVLPKWLGWVAILLGIIAFTPIGFAAFVGTALWVLIVSILLSIRARGASPTPAAPTV